MKRLLAVLLCVAMLVSFAACASKPTDDTKPSDNAPAESSKPAESTAPADEPSSEHAEVRDSLNIGVDGDCGTLDPYSLSGAGFLTVAYSILEPLWIYDGTGTVRYLLCESVDNVSDTEFVLHLRQGVTFSNGSPFNADDVLWTFNYVYTQTPRAYNFASIDMENVEKVDDYTVRLHFTKPDVTQLPILSDVFILDDATYDANTVSTNPIGTGAYVVKDYVVNSTCTVEANPTYWGGEPEVKNIVFKNIPEASQKVTALETGEIDYIVTCPTSDADYVDTLNGNHAIFKDSISMVCLTYNCAKTSPFATKEARWAASYACNSQGIIDVALNGHGSLAKSLTAPVCNDYLPELDNLHDTYTTGYNLELAKKYAEESGLVGQTVRIVTNGSDTFVTAAQILEQSLKEIGVNAQVVNLDQATVRNLTVGEADWEIYVSYMAGSSAYGSDFIYAQAIKFNRTHFDWDTETFNRLKTDGEALLGTTDKAAFDKLNVEYMKEFEEHCSVFGIAAMQTIRGCSDFIKNVSTEGYAHDRIFEWSING